MNRECMQASQQASPGAMLRAGVMLYSVVSYLVGVAALVYLILFIADLWVPITLNRGIGTGPNLGGVAAVLWNAAIVLAWGLQHSVMARPAFKRVWTRVVPVAVERSTYLLCVASVTALMVLSWVPLPTVIWDLSGTVLAPVLIAAYFSGWVITLFSTFLINHFHLFGLQQAFHFMRRLQSKQETFVKPLLYKFVRHPMMSGVLIALWSAPVLTTSRLVFNLLMTAYVFVGLYYEERTLCAELGDEYRRYRLTTPSVMPRLRRREIPQSAADRI